MEVHQFSNQIFLYGLTMNNISIHMDAFFFFFFDLIIFSISFTFNHLALFRIIIINQSFGKMAVFLVQMYWF